MKKFFSEFRGFVLRGNVLNLAVGVIIGAAFQGIVTSLTENILSPILGVFGGLSFDAWHIKIMEVDIRYGAFLTSVINFLIMAFVIFLLVKAVNGIMTVNKTPPPPPDTRACPFCTTTISVKATRCPACTSELDEQSA
jgi:large conductance mechanosensitive channel